MIEIHELYKTFHAGESIVTAAKNVNLTIADNEFISIVGRSGSGKSTLMHLIGGLDHPDSGTITVNEQVITALSSNQLAAYRASQTGFVFQSFHLEPQYTVYDNIRMPLLISGVPYAEHRKKSDSVLKQVGMLEKRDVRTAKLSGGERQRVAIARALINDAPILLADEPCGNLDSVNSRIIMDLLGELHRMGKTIILVTHNLADAERTERIIELQDGEIIRDEKNKHITI